MELYKNVLLEWRSDTVERRLERLLWLDLAGKEAVMIVVDDRKARPVRRKITEIESALSASEARILHVDPYAFLCRPEQELSAKQREDRDKSWSLIAPLLESLGGEVYDFSNHHKSIYAYAKRTGHPKSTIYDVLRRYWQRGQTKNALIPLYDQCGWRGREKIKRQEEHKKERKKIGRPSKVAEATGIPTGVNVTEDVLKRFRWGYKLYYETKEEKTLSKAFQRTLESFFHCGYYRNKDGVLIPALPPASELPTYQQFKFWYKRERNPRRSQIARSGERKFNLTGRAITGDSTQMAFGPGSIYQIDATIGDAYLVSSLDRNWTIGRPVIYIVIDMFSRMVAGFSVTLEGPSWVGAMLALENAATDKVSFCAEYGITIEESEWPCYHLPEALLADRGELEGYNADHLVNAFGIRVHNTAPYRADMKGIVEQHFDLCNEKFIKWIPGAVRKRERGERDYRLDAVLDLNEFRKLMILSILNHNNHKRLDAYRKDEFMIADHVEPYPIDLWSWGIVNRIGHLDRKSAEVIRLNLLPEVEASITGRGISCEGLFYTCDLARNEQWFERAREKKRKTEKIRVARDPRKVDRIYLRLDSGKRMETCYLLEADRTFKGRDWHEAADEFELRKQRKEKSLTRKYQSTAEFNASADLVVAGAKEKTEQGRRDDSNRARVSSIRDNRKRERETEREATAWELGDVSAHSATASGAGEGGGQTNEGVAGYVPPAQPMDKLREIRKRRTIR